MDDGTYISRTVFIFELVQKFAHQGINETKRKRLFVSLTFLKKKIHVFDKDILFLIFSRPEADVA